MAVECRHCNYVNDDKAKRCFICGTKIDNDNNPNPSDISLSGKKGSPLSPPNIQPSPSPPFETRGNILEGRITQVNRQDERLAPDFYEIIGKLLTGFIIIVIFMIFFFILAGITLGLIFAGFKNIAQLCSPHFWIRFGFDILESVFGKKTRKKDTVPMYRGLVEKKERQPHAFIMKGPLTGCDLIAGHNVRFYGRYKRGVFIARRGIDLTSNAEIKSGYHNTWKFIFFTIVLIYIIILALPLLHQWGIR